LKLERAAAALFGVAVLAPVALACGGGSHFPDPPECVEPTPTPSGREEQRSSGFAYVVTLANGFEELQRLSDEFELRWPGQRFSSRREFREEFAMFAGESACLVNALIALEPTDPERFGAFEQEADAALQHYLNVLERGREAVRKRNVSKYREFHRELDDAQARLDALLDQRPR